MTLFDESPGTQSTELRRKSGVSHMVKKYPSLQVSHYPVLLFSDDRSTGDAAAPETQSKVVWKTSSNSNSPPSSEPAHNPLSNEKVAPCSPSRLQPPSKMSFSTLVNSVRSANAAGGIDGGSVRCLSSASPMTATERQHLWSSLLHHSFEGPAASASTESLYNSCTEIDPRFRQQRKRRAGISSGSASIQKGTPFASSGATGNGCSSAVPDRSRRYSYCAGRGHPTLGGRSPQSSFDSNTDVAQISMNWMRMNGLGQGFRPLMTANSGHTPKASHSSTQLCHTGSLRKMHAVSSLDDRLPRSGTQADVGYDGDATSRKSVSIAYSNDLEAQKFVCGAGGGGGGDDSETPLMDEKEDNSGGRLIKREQLHERRRVMCDRALTFAIIGIVLMIIENELRSGHYILTGSLWSLALKSLILGSTCILVIFAAYFHIIEVQLFMNANAADDWRVSLTGRRVAQIATELFVCSLCPLPLELGEWGRNEMNAKTLHSLNVLLSISMFFRLYWLCRVMLLHSRLFTDASSRSIAGLNRVNFNARFILKTLMTLCPGTMLLIFTASLWIMAGWILRLCEREYISMDRRKDSRHLDDYVSSIWLVAITFLSVGYGDIVPQTNCGRTMAVVTGILGTCASSMVVAVIARKLELTRAEKHVHNFMMDTQLTKQLKHSAANVLRETWLIYKYRKLVEKTDFARVRQHQRKFLVAIYELRKVKRDQRKLAENLVSLGDVAKTSSNTYELVHDVHSTQEGLSLRITAIEHQLGDISRELSGLVELLKGRRASVSEAEGSPQNVRRRKHGEMM